MLRRWIRWLDTVKSIKFNGIWSKSCLIKTHQQKIINPIILTSARDKSLRATALSANDDELLSSHNH